MGAPLGLLRRVSLLASLTDGELAQLAERFRERRCDRGCPATSEGSGGVGFFVIAQGEATVRVHGEVVRRLGPGDHFGEVAVIDGGRRSAQIVADTNILCYGLPAAEFRSLVKQHPQVAWALLETIVSRLRETQDRSPRAHVAT